MNRSQVSQVCVMRKHHRKGEGAKEKREVEG